MSRLILLLGLLSSIPLTVNLDDEDFRVVDDDLDRLRPLLLVNVDDCIVDVVDDLRVGDVLLELLFLQLLLFLLEEVLLLYLEEEEGYFNIS